MRRAPRWTKLAKADASAISAGDIISLDRGDGNVWRVRIRKAADELERVERLRAADAVWGGVVVGVKD